MAEALDSSLALHDRRVPGTKGNHDHIVVAPAGVFVVDAKHLQGDPLGLGEAALTSAEALLGRPKRAARARSIVIPNARSAARPLSSSTSSAVKAFGVVA